MMIKNRSLIDKLLLIFTLLGITLAACAPPAEPGATPVATTAVEDTPVPATEAPPTEAPTVVPTPVEPTPTTVAEPSPEATPEPSPEASPTFVPTPTGAAGGELPIVEEASFTVIGQSGGVPHALAVDGTTAYVGFGPRLFVLDVSDSANPQLLGQSEPLPDIARGVDVAGGIVYVAAGGGGLIILDAADPANPTVISDGPNDAGANQPSAEDVTVVNNTAYVTDFNRMDGSTDLLRFDVSDPAQVSLLDTLELGQNESVVIADNAIVVVGNNRFQLRDAADPQTVLSETTLASGTFANRAAVHENILTLAESGETGGNGIEQFDISDPAAPVLVRELVPLEFFFVAETVTDGERLFFDETFGEFGHCGSQIHAVDLSGDTPQQAATFDPANCVTELELAGDTLYVTGRSGLQLYNVSDLANPTLSGEFRHPVGFHGVEGVAVQEGIGYVLAGEGRSFDVATVDLSQPDNPQPGERLTIGTETLQELFITGNTLIASVWMGGLNTLDISDPAAPELLYQAVSGELLTGDFFAMAIGENVVYTPIVGENLVGAVGTIDLSDPANPTVAATVETGAPQVVSLALDGDTLYALTQGEVAEIHVFDVSQPLELTPTATLELPEYASELALVGDTMFAICDGFNCQNLYGVDVSDPQNPTMSGQWAMPVGAVETAADGQGIIYLITPVEGIWVLNATDPANPYLAGRLQVAGDFARLKLVEDTIYAAAFDAGLYVIQADQ